MKTIAVTIALLATMAAGAWATEPTKTGQLNNTSQEAILSPELEELFKNERLNEAVAKPVYNAAEQIIFSEQVKQLKSSHQTKSKKRK